MGALGRRNTPVQVLFGETADDTVSALSAVRSSSGLAELVRCIRGNAYENEDVAAAAVEIVTRCPNLVELYICLPSAVGLHARLRLRGLSSLRKLALSFWNDDEGLQEVPIDEIFNVLQLMPSLDYCLWQSIVINYERFPITAAASMHLPERFIVPDLPSSAAIPILCAPHSDVRISQLVIKPEDIQFLRGVDWKDVTLSLTSLTISMRHLSTGGTDPADPVLYASLLSACPRLQELRVAVHPSASASDCVDILRAMLSVKYCRVLILDIFIGARSEPDNLAERMPLVDTVIDLLCQSPPAISALRLLELSNSVLLPGQETSRRKMLAFCRARRIRCKGISDELWRR